MEYETVSFAELVSRWKKNKYRSISETSQYQYEKLLRLYYNKLLHMPIYHFSARTIDNWIDDLHVQLAYAKNKKTRVSFEKEFELLKQLINFYIDWYEPKGFESPFRERHKEAIIVREPTPKERRIPVTKYLSFLEKLLDQDDGILFGTFSVVQFYESLRVSEAAALASKHIHFDHLTKSKSYILIDQSIVYHKDKGKRSYVQNGFKNGVMKILPMFPEVYLALINFLKYFESDSKFLFNKYGTFLNYRTIQRKYNRAFIDAGLMEYSATQIMRHGGCQRAYNASGGNINVASELLANTDEQSIRTYAKSYGNAVFDFATLQWVNCCDVGKYQSTEELLKIQFSEFKSKMLNAYSKVGLEFLTEI